MRGKLCGGLLCTMLAAMMLSCGNDNDEQETFHVRNTTNSGCKATYSMDLDGLDKATLPTIYDGIEAVRLTALQSGYLRLKHMNVTHSCEAKDVKLSVEKNGTTITVSESSNVESDCTCIYDLGCEVGPLEQQDYVLVLKVNGETVLQQPFRYQSGADILLPVEQ